MRRAAAGAPGRQEGRGAPAEGLGPRRGRLSQCSATAHLLRPRRLRHEGSSDRVAQRLEPGRRRQLRGHGRVRLGMHGQRGEAQPTALPSGSSAAPPAVVGSAPTTAHAKALAAALAASGGKLGSSGMGKGFYCDARPMAAGCRAGKYHRRTRRLAPRPRRRRPPPTLPPRPALSASPRPRLRPPSSERTWVAMVLVDPWRPGHRPRRSRRFPTGRHRRLEAGPARVPRARAPEGRRRCAAPRSPACGGPARPRATVQSAGAS